MNMEMVTKNVTVTDTMEKEDRPLMCVECGFSLFRFILVKGLKREEQFMTAAHCFIAIFAAIFAAVLAAMPKVAVWTTR